MRPEVRVKKGKCDLHSGDAELWGIELTVERLKLTMFICECCLKNLLGEIGKRSYMDDAVY